jgi:G3E family GTPase
MEDRPPVAPGSGSRLPVSLLTGFLGAGKTTLVNRVLRELHGERIAVLVNEFGAVGIDGRLVVSSQDNLVELVNGCVCCEVRGDLREAVVGLLRRRRRRLFRAQPFERLLVETSGLANPGPVLQTFLLDAELAAETRSDGVVTLVHAGAGGEVLERHPEAASQVGYADCILLNHADLATEEALAALEEELGRRNSLAPVYRTRHAELAVERILGLASGERQLQKLREAPAGAAHTEGAASVVLRATGPLDLHRLKMWIQFVSARRVHELWRVKGVVRCADHPRPVVVQGVHQWLELGPGEGEAPAESVLVLIGRGLDRDELERGWVVCAAG